MIHINQNALYQTKRSVPTLQGSITKLKQGDNFFQTLFSLTFPDLREISLNSQYSILEETEIISLNLRSGRTFSSLTPVKIP